MTSGWLSSAAICRLCPPGNRCARLQTARHRGSGLATLLALVEGPTKGHTAQGRVVTPWRRRPRLLIRWPHWQRIISLGACCCQWVSSQAPTPAPPWRAACSRADFQASKSGVCLVAHCAAETTHLGGVQVHHEFFLHRQATAKSLSAQPTAQTDPRRFQTGAGLKSVGDRTGRVRIGQTSGNSLDSLLRVSRDTDQFDEEPSLRLTSRNCSVREHGRELR